MTWTDHYLVMPDGTPLENHRTSLESLGAAVDDIGLIFRNDTHEPCDGYHVNIRLGDGTEMPEGLIPYLIEPPALPKRLFMGA